ncbi:MAG: hypothetical protein V2J24_19150 [Pseudomonadales bacterium]|jgi:hypothetical protein|nr:hypothetical protein [Pseudomonadales bacterium]
MNSSRLLAMTLGALLLTACSFRAPQYDAARGLVRALLDREPPQLAADPESAWVYRLNGFEAVFYAFEDEQGLGFVSEEGARLRFDGFDLGRGSRLPNAVRGFTVRKEPDGRRIHDVDGFARYEMVCGAPLATEAGWETRCDYASPADGLPRRIVHRLQTNEAGLARRIELTLVPGAEPLVLERLQDLMDEASFRSLSARVVPEG